MRINKLDKFEKQQKFYAAMAFFVLNGLFCKWLHLGDVAYQSVAGAVVVSFLAATAVVEWKHNT